MKVAIVGSRGLKVDIAQYLPKKTTEIITGGAKGVDTLAERYARENGIPFCVLKPEYRLLGAVAPLVRNEQIVDRADMVVAIWDGVSRGTRHAIAYAEKTNKPLKVYIVKP